MVRGGEKSRAVAFGLAASETGVAAMLCCAIIATIVRMSDIAGSYDLLARRTGWKPQAALIVSPYVEEHFFRTVAGELRPKRMHVVIDDGCRREDLQTVQDAVNACGRKRPPTLRCKLGSARGLVHIKLFYVLWETAGGRAAHSLVFGSANATRQGFSGTDNAELVALRSRNGDG
jgi:hypothetical protein